MNNVKMRNEKKNNMNNLGKKSNDKPKSWAFIIFVTIFLWPLGLYFLNKKFHEENLSINVTSNMKKLALGLVAIGIFGALTPPPEQNPNQNVIGPMIFLILGGVAVFIFSNKLKQYSIKYQKYNAIINTEGVTSIDNIAATVQVPYEVVVKDLQDMISRDYFKDAYIDDASREVRLLNKTSQENIKTQSNKQEQEKVVVACNGCGANNTILKGTVGECEYCGKSIKG